MVLFIVHCFPKVNGIFALPLGKASLFQRVTYLQVMNYCLKALRKNSGGKGHNTVADFKEGSFFEHDLVASKSRSWVLGIQ